MLELLNTNVCHWRRLVVDLNDEDDEECKIQLIKMIKAACVLGVYGYDDIELGNYNIKLKTGSTELSKFDSTLLTMLRTPPKPRKKKCKDANQRAVTS